MKRILSLSLLLLFSISLCLSFSSCGIDVQYENAENYTAGSARLKTSVTGLDIAWLEGEVQISYHASDEIDIKEYSNRKLEDHEKVRWFVDGKTLRIRYSESGKWQFKNLSKAVEIKLPYGMELAKTDISSVSANITTDGLAANKLNVESNSGNVTLKMAQTASFKLSFKTETGQFSSELNLKEELGHYVLGLGYNSFEIKTNTGNLNIAKK